MPDLTKCPTCGKPLKGEVRDTAAGNTPAEIAYLCPDHGCQAYFAYGHYDPACPIH